jgi:alpha-amylase/alpha-mannosidase (GH57 family)
VAEVALALLWHQHQPYYPDDVAGQNPMPWVRLHGVKDYYGMALQLLEFPEMRCTINLVPSLVRQIVAYTDESRTDRCLDVARLPASSLSEEDCLFLLDNFFMANPDHMILPFPRYAELFRRRGAGRNTAREALRRFRQEDFRDLQVWFNLTWVHPLACERDDLLKSLHAKGKAFTEKEKAALLDKHLEILREILPLHRKLAESGQVELTTTPYFHPILPLLFDKKLAREAMPDVKLPRYTGGYPADAAVHIERALVEHTRVFGKAPQGMWPAEGSVCQLMLPLLVAHGIRWIASDEEILAGSTHGLVSRDHHGHVRSPDALYRPYKVGPEGAELSIVFRDHALSDLIGFQYQRSDPVTAAENFVGNLLGIGKAVTFNHPALVSVILDGENCWEHYPGGGVAFLRALYENCVRTPGLQPVKVGEYLEQYPPRDSLPHLFAGSWINHNFAIWVGHDEDNTGWDALHRTREYLVQKGHEVRAGKTAIAPKEIERAWEEIYIAEGSDWFWWFGDDHSSAQDALFDYLFRKHLQNVYLLLGDTPPPDLDRPISRHGQRVPYSMPRSFLDVQIDGRATFFEWLAAGCYLCRNERGTMARAMQGPVREVQFGFNLDMLWVRVNCDGPAQAALATAEELRIAFVEPAGYELRVERPGRPDQAVRLLHHGLPVADDPASPRRARFAIEYIGEAGIPFDLLGLAVDQPFGFYVEVLEGGQSKDRAPRDGAIALTRPSPDFEQIMWDV